jgi:cytochrome c biogenesis protein CcmG/thiol:disulfide interchange protein DsbE
MSEPSLPQDHSRRALLLAAAGAIPGLALGAYAWRRYGLTGRLLNPLSAEKFDLPPVPGLLDASGAPVPGFSAADIAGKTFYLSAFASWCPNCLEEHQSLMEFSRTSGVAILGMASLDDPANTLKFLRKEGNPFVRVGVDRKGYLYRALGARGIPAHFVMGPAPRVTLMLQGAQGLEALREKILPLIAGA